jgi:ribonuclease-3
MSAAQDLEPVLGYRFVDERLLEEALTHSSVAEHRLRSNERMEFLGDAVLGWVISEYLFQAFPTYEEGELTKIKSAVVSRKACAQISVRLGLDVQLNLGKGMNVKGALPGSIAAGVLESVIAAVYLDGGIQPAKAFILRYMGPLVHEMDANAHQHNFKSVLQQHAQRQMDGQPSYLLLDEKGPDHSKCFEVCVEIARRRFPSCWANSKKEAEQGAALKALSELGVAVVDEQGQVRLQDDPSRAARA